MAAGISAPALAATHQTSMSPKGTKIATVVTKKYGRILANTKGRVMYLHTTDKGTVSKCPGACAAAWPKVTSKVKPLAGKGISAKHLKRNSKDQVLYFGHPLYYFATGKGKGNASGEGLADFFVVGTNGKAIKHAKPTKTTGPTGPAEVNTGDVGASSTEVLITKAGRTLYALDMPTEPTFFCNSGCTSVWIPLLTKGTPTAAGDVMQSLLGTINHPGVGTQVTYNGDPVYRYSPDSAAGQDTGEGLAGPYSTFDVNETWYDMTPAGTFNTTS